MDSKDLAHIIENHTRIILPDFGAFLLKDSGNGIFKPENLTFSPFLKYNDNVLEEYYAKYKEVPKDEAIKQTKAFIESLKETIKAQGYFDIPGIGRLMRDGRGAIIFTASGKSISPTDTVKPVANKPQKKSKKILEEISNVDINEQPESKQEPSQEDIVLEIDTQEPINEELSESQTFEEQVFVNESIIEIEEELKEPATEQNQPILSTNINTENPYNQEENNDMAKTKKKSKLTLILIYLGISLSAILIFAFIIREIAFNNEIRESNRPSNVVKEKVEKNETETVVPEKEIPKDEIDKAFDEMTTDDASESAESNIETQIEKSVIENAAIKQPATEQFHLIAGSFKDKLNAEKYAKELKTAGYKSEVLTLPNGKNYVTVGSFPSKEKANQEKSKLTQKFPSIWILKQ
ncbi:MAG TPA: SPOR domain-containing protein [Tenuifilaceae bacterium]|nr:SPOR domain-containing protein [Tenuifilaceae bacterium]